MPLPQTFHRMSTKVKKFISNRHCRVRALGSPNPRTDCSDTLEKPASGYKSKEKQREIGHHLNLWSPLKQKTQAVSGTQLTANPFFVFVLGVFFVCCDHYPDLTFYSFQEWFQKLPLFC